MSIYVDYIDYHPGETPPVLFASEYYKDATPAMAWNRLGRGHATAGSGKRVKHRALTRWCRLTADGLDELHAAARKRHMTPRLFREQPFPHYPIDGRLRWEYLRMGAKVIGQPPARPFVFRIPNWLPPSLNVLLRLHWAKRNDQAKAAYEMIYAYFVAAGIPKALGTRRRVSVRFTLPKGQRRSDPDNLLKVLLDGLKRCGAIVDDGPKWCELGPVCFDRGELATTITLEDI